ncbi:MAG TPA: hypothetical protein VMH80_09675 [Bryobacteraceae bacterium]|nr:hypothetical protein [Bryobacteraceae bacterium]
MANPDSRLLQLFQRGYGFYFETHSKKHYYQFQWRSKKTNSIIMVLPFEVPMDRPADRRKVARMLGLSEDELAAAEQGKPGFDMRCLQFVLMVTQAHLSMAMPRPPHYQTDLQLELDLMLGELEGRAKTEDCYLLAKVRDLCADLAKNPVWQSIAKRVQSVAVGERI